MYLFGKKPRNEQILTTFEWQYDFSKPGLSQWVTFGRNGYGELAEVVLSRPERNYHKIIVNHEGRFEDFPGIIQGKWINSIAVRFDFNEGRIRFRTDFEKHGDGYRCLWEIQPDGSYWADSDGFGADNDMEIVLYADLDADGCFLSPFRIYKLGNTYIEET